MKRGVTLGIALVALALPAMAGARPKMSMKRTWAETRNVARFDIRGGWATRYRVMRCGRDDSVRTYCLLREWGAIYQPGSPAGRGDDWVGFYLAPDGALRVKTSLDTYWT